MKRHFCAALLALALLPVLSGCGASDASVSTVEASGEGRAKVAATRASAAVAVSVRDKTVDDVNNLLSQRSRAVLAYLASQKAEAVRTDAVQLEPHFDYANNTRKPNGFDGSVTIRFEGDVKEIGSLVTGALCSGANNVDGIETTPADKDEEAARKTAIALAVQDALSQARAALGAANLKETKIRHLTVSVGGRGPVATFKALGAPVAAGAPLPVEGGTQEIAANVQVTLEFERK